MKKVLVLTTIAALIAIMCIPAGAAYVTNWTEEFEGYSLGDLNGQGVWVNAGGTSTKSTVVQNTTVFGGAKAASQAVGVSQSKANLVQFGGNGLTFKQGYAKFWVYDPGNVGTVQTDGRVGVFSSAGADNIGKIFSAQIQANNATDYWEAQWSYSAVMMDGGAPVTGAGYTFTPGLPAPRIRNAWNYVLITWAYNYTDPVAKTGSATIKYYVNQMSVSPNMTLNIDSSSTRWANTKDIAGVCIGALYATSTPASFDNIEFHANTIPEPSSLLALGTGALGLLGLIRRRK